MPRIGRYGILGLAVAIACLALGAREALAEDVFFESHVRPILKTHCFACHGEEDKPEGNLDLRLVRTITKGGETGPAIVPGKPAESLVVQRIAIDEMPPGKKKVSPREKATIGKWLEQGARTKRPEPEALATASPWTDEERGHWSYQPIRRSPLPQVKRADLINSPIDAFLLSKLESQGLSFSPATDRRTLIRRLSFDLLGLPPAPERAHAFVNDSSPDAYERLVDEYLASPAYGERWARHWLDPAGYADSNGYAEQDSVRPWSFRYRDYVIRSLNADKPFDQFIVEQLAGDELLAPPYVNLSPEQADLLIATGFLRMAPDGTGDSGVDQNTARNEVVAETIKIVSSTLLGVSVGCAQCHNHRYDAVSQQDYYRLRAIFEPALDYKNWRAPAARLVNLWTCEEQERAAKVDAELKEIEKQRLAELDEIVTEIFEREISKLPAEQQPLAREAKGTEKPKRTPEQQQILRDHPSLNVDRGSAYLYDRKRMKEFTDKHEKRTAETKANRPAESFVACLTEIPDKVPPTHLFSRGDFNQPREVVKPGDLSVFGEAGAKVLEDDPQLPTSGRRLAYAKSLTNGRHPLVPRVLVNRIWLHHFGRGLVATPSDFGTQGERPSHGELLDWLADEFTSGGWRLKPLHRLLVLSTVYQQQSVRTPQLQSVDPENRLLGRMPIRRLESEAIRDAMLYASGSRRHAMFGPPSAVNPDEVGQVIIGKAAKDGNGLLVAKFEENDEQFRRSIYIQVRRSMPLGMLEPFDVASTAPNCELRPTSTVAPQSLLLMNSDFVLRQSARFAGRLKTESGDDPAAQIRLAWQLAFGQAASETEVNGALAFLAAQSSYFEKQPAEKDKPAPDPAQQALAVFCQALFSANGFLYVD